MLFLISLLLVAISFFISFQSHGIYGGDAGDLVTAAFLGGVAHPPGFPLYTLLGHLLTLIPIATVAWRVGLISSLAAALTLTVLAKFLKEMGHSTLSIIVALLILSATYLFWLYAIVPEVFMLNLLFSSSLLLVCFRYWKSKQTRYLYLFSLLFGLALAHHHIIIFLLPSFSYLFYQSRKRLVKLSKIVFAKSVALFALGLSPYLYIFYAAAKNTAVNWNNVTNLPNFIHLVTRADYGTFQSGPTYAQSITSRLLQIPVIAELLRIDFTYIGIVLAVMGLIIQLKKNPVLSRFLLLGFLFTGPVYFFYASYGLQTGFSLGTLERFVLPTYIFITVWISYALDFFLKWLDDRLSSFPTSRRKFYQLMATCFMFLLPLYIFKSNLYKFIPLRADFTAENYATDMLETAPKGSILLLQRDNALFNIQYIQNAKGVRQDVVAIHLYRLFKGELQAYLKDKYPQLRVGSDKGEKVVNLLIKDNYRHWPIFSNTPLTTPFADAVWVRQGLLMRLYKKEDLPEAKEVLAENKKLWPTYHDPLSGALGVFRHWMPGNIIDFYEEGRVESGILFEQGGDLSTATNFYREAVRLDPDDPDNQYHLARALAKQEKCEAGLKTLEPAIKKEEKIAYVGLMRDIYALCFKDDDDAEKWNKRLLELQKAGEQKLEEL